MATYSRKPVEAPRLSGLPLKLFVSAVEGPLGAPLLAKLTGDSGLEAFRQKTPGDASPISIELPFPDEPPPPALSPAQLAEQAMNVPSSPPGGAKLETVGWFARAYRRGETDPVQVARRAVEAINRFENDEHLGLFVDWHSEDVLSQAEASARRWAAREPRSVLDGVPVAIKDELDMVPFGTTLGTSFLGEKIAVQDATLVARLREAGAVLLGKTNMHEVGINPIGHNTHYGPSRNPFHRGRYTGGSSSGSAGAVAAGLCPIALGADGGGSIRVPSALCSLVGLKPTFGRLSEGGVPALCWTVAHAGPIGLTVRDVAIAYAFIAGPDPRDPNSLRQPPVHLSGLDRLDLTGLRLGICDEYFRDAEPEVVKANLEVVRALCAAGASRVEVALPDWSAVMWAHTVIILSEMASVMLPFTDEDPTRFGYDVRTNLAIGRHFTATDLVHAMRHRHRLTREYLKLFQDIDVLVTPTTAITAPPIPEAALPEGQSDLVTSDALMRFIRAPNLTGFPALSVPAGYDSTGLPVGCQLMGRPYEEALLLRVGLCAEQAVVRREPAIHTTLLP